MVVSILFTFVDRYDLVNGPERTARKPPRQQARDAFCGTLFISKRRWHLQTLREACKKKQAQETPIRRLYRTYYL